MPSPRQYAGVAVLDDRIYVVGGRDATGYSAKNERLTPHPLPVDIFITSPEDNQRYLLGEGVNFSFIVNRPLNGIVDLKYSLDGQTATPLTGNTTLSSLSDGAHSLTVYATDKQGNGGTAQTATFTIAESQTPTPTPQPTQTPTATPTPSPTMSPSPSPTETLNPSPSTSQPTTPATTQSAKPTVTTQPTTSPAEGSQNWQANTFWIIAASVVIAAVAIIVYAAVTRKRKA